MNKSPKFKGRIFYEAYPNSFYDSNNDSFKMFDGILSYRREKDLSAINPLENEQEFNIYDDSKIIYYIGGVHLNKQKTKLAKHAGVIVKEF